MSGIDIPLLGGGPGQAMRPRLLGENPLRGDGLPVGGAAAGTGFGGLLEQAIDHVQSLQDTVTDATNGIAMGKKVQLHDLMLAMGRSENSFNLMLEVRNKLVDAWEKVSRSVV